MIPGFTSSSLCGTDDPCWTLLSNQSLFHIYLQFLFLLILLGSSHVYFPEEVGFRVQAHSSVIKDGVSVWSVPRVHSYIHQATDHK